MKKLQSILAVAMIMLCALALSVVYPLALLLNALHKLFFDILVNHIKWRLYALIVKWNFELKPLS